MPKAKRSFKKAVRSNNDGERYPGGKLKPPKPNAKVVATRRALLGASPGEEVDLTRAENALDVALARGWLNEAHHRAAQSYAMLAREGLGRLPTLRVGQLSEQAAPAALRFSEDGLNRSGVITSADAELLKKLGDLEAGRIDEREYRRAEKAHRAAKIDWSRVPSADIAKMFDVLMEGTPRTPLTMTGAVSDERGERAFHQLRQIWDRLTPNEARELFAVCVGGAWPKWLLGYITGRQIDRDARTKLLDLERGLEKVIDVLDRPRHSGGAQKC